MFLRIAVFILIAAGLAGIGAVAWLGTLTTPSPSPTVPEAAAAPPVTVSVLAAARNLLPGVLLKPDDLTAVSMTQPAVPAGARPDTPAARAELLGGMLRRAVAAGEVLLPIHVVRAGDRGFLAAVLGQGMRGTTVAVDAVTGSAGLIWPGDHVDLILTQTIDDPNAPLGRRVAGETVLHNVRVIAIDQDLMQGATASSPNGGAVQSRTVTLEVSPENAQRVAVVTRLGHLSLSVISADTPDGPTITEASAEQVSHAPVTWGGDVSSALQAGHKADTGSGSIHLYEGGADAKEVHF